MDCAPAPLLPSPLNSPRTVPAVQLGHRPEAGPRTPAPRPRCPRSGPQSQCWRPKHPGHREEVCGPLPIPVPTRLCPPLTACPARRPPRAPLPPARPPALSPTRSGHSTPGLRAPPTRRRVFGAQGPTWSASRAHLGRTVQEGAVRARTLTRRHTDTLTHTQEHSHAHTQAHAHTHTLTHICRHTQTHTYTLTHTDTRTLTLAHTDTLTHMYTHTRTDTRTFTHTLTHSHTGTQPAARSVAEAGLSRARGWQGPWGTLPWETGAPSRRWRPWAQI